MPAEDTLNCDVVANCFINSPEIINQTICDRSPSWGRHWWNMVPQANYAWQQGYSKTKYTLRVSGVPQDLEWVPVEEERAAGTNGPGDPGHDPCDYTAHLVTYGLDAVNYGAFRTHVSTNRFCLDSMLHKTLLLQQWELMIQGWENTTVGIFEKAHKLFYLLFSDIYVATPDPTSFIATEYVPTAIGDLPNIAGLQVVPLSMDHLRCLYEYISRDLRAFSIGETNGAPNFIVSSSPETINDLYAQTPEAFDILKRQDDNKLFDGIGLEFTREHFVFMKDLDASRFNETFPGSGVLTEVFRESLASAVCGTGAYTSTDYVYNSDFELTIIGLKPGAVVTANIPNPFTSLPGDADYGPRNYLGDFRFVRPPADCGNEKRNQGWWFAEFFAEPEPGCARGKAIVHRRCKPALFNLGDCEPCEYPDPCDPTPDAQPDAVVVVGEPTQLDVDLDSALPAAIAGPLAVGYILSFTLQNGDVEAGVVIDNASDPVHRIQFNADATEWASAGSNPIVSTTDPALSQCGTICACDDTVGNSDQIQVEFEEGTFYKGVGGLETLTFGDASTEANVEIVSIGLNPQRGQPTYLLEFAGDTICTDNDGLVSYGTCP